VQELCGWQLPRLQRLQWLQLLQRLPWLSLPRWGRFSFLLRISGLFAAPWAGMSFFDTRGVRMGPGLFDPVVFCEYGLHEFDGLLSLVEGEEAEDIHVPDIAVEDVDLFESVVVLNGKLFYKIGQGGFFVTFWWA
jgi:hypothetical protein